jgi:hypothetical protein
MIYRDQSYLFGSSDAIRHLALRDHAPRLPNGQLP